MCCLACSMTINIISIVSQTQTQLKNKYHEYGISKPTPISFYISQSICMMV